jgi:Predicted Rossmann fold nucleotide-binding protein involved in DNA uptake
MLENGGLITEFMSGTNPDRQNFIKRNRIVAGMSDGVVVIQSAVKGGALITADIADSYGRDCFAFPGSVYDECCKGCNELIRENKAMLITSAHDMVEQLGWQAKERKPQIQRELFPVLSDDEKRIVEILSSSPEGIQINRMVVELNIPINRLSALLLELEMKGIIRSLAGGMYRIIH